MLAQLISVYGATWEYLGVLMNPDITYIVKCVYTKNIVERLDSSIKFEIC